MNSIWTVHLPAGRWFVVGAFVGALSPPGVSALEPLGNVLRLAKSETTPGAVELSWMALPVAIGYAIQRCDASLAGCVPASYQPSFTAHFDDTDTASARLWYSVAARLDDRFRGNRTAADARSIDDSVQPLMVVGPGTDDWYRFQLCDGALVTIDAEFSDAEGNIDLRLYREPNAVLVAASVSTIDDESITFLADESAVYLLEVTLVEDDGPEPGNVYDLALSGTSINTCTDDASEPNNSLATAAPFSTVDWNNLTACPFEDDFFTFDLAVGESLSVQVLGAAPDGDLDIYLYDPAGVLIAEVVGPPNTLEWLNVTVPGIYTFRVVLVANTGCSGIPYAIEGSSW